jgi:uncharacterized SAM-binding protein YcdF (DUF218 family)
VDQELIVSVASRMPNATFAFVGPAQTDVSALERCPNVRLLGQRPHPDVPRYVKGFDVGIVPYRLTEYTANVYPTKLNEYLVMGIPVVATDLPEIRRFNAEHDDIVEVAADPQRFCAAIEGALSEAVNNSGTAHAARRIEIAHTNSWRARIADMNRLIDQALERRGASQPQWDETLRRVYRETRTHIAQIALAVVASYALIFQTNLVWWAAAPLSMTAPPQPSDAIVVFAGGVGESGKAGGGAQERLQRAVELYKAGQAPNVVLSSGYVFSFREAETMRALAIDQGIPPAAIVVEDRSINTYQNVTFVEKILHDRHWTSVLLVSSPYHMRRALLVWRKVAPEVRVIPTPALRSQFYDHTRGASLEQVGGILHEYLAILGYWRRGWI